jgi:regulator of protease activity HflC (stomatin/prohibitin superfamily)
MLHRLKTLTGSIRTALNRAFKKTPAHPIDGFDTQEAAAPVAGRRRALSRQELLSIGLVGSVGLAAYALVTHPPLQNVAPGELGLRTNLFTGETQRFRDGTVLVLPAVHELQRYSLRDKTWRASRMARAGGEAPLQSIEGLSLGLDLSIRYALDASTLGQRALPQDIDGEIIEPAVQGVAYRVMAQHTVREIFSSQRAQIVKAIETELRTKLAAEGLIVRHVQIGNVDLPADYKRGLDGLLAEGLATEKMRYTLELKDKRVKETELEANADKVRRETNAEAAAREQVIAARAQEEAMKHVLPFKQRQIEQRQLEAEAERVSRVKMAEGSAQARRIEAAGEADARQKLADAEAYRVTKIGKAGAEQMALEGALISKHPLLIQKTLADKLSDKIQVIIAPPPADGGFIGSALVGALKTHASAEEPATATKEQ